LTALPYRETHSVHAHFEVRKVFFFEKKKQKTFALEDMVLPCDAAFFLSADRLNIIFLLLFFKKEVLASLKTAATPG